MSSIGVVKTRLVAILSAALPASQVVPGPVDVTTLGPRVVVVGGEATPIQIDVSSLDGSTGTEKYVLTLTFSVSSAGTALGQVESLAVDDFRAALSVIRADISLGIEGLSAQVSGQAELTEKSNAQGRSAAVRCPVSVFAPV